MQTAQEVGIRSSLASRHHSKQLHKGHHANTWLPRCSASPPHKYGAAPQHQAECLLPHIQLQDLMGRDPHQTEKVLCSAPLKLGIGEGSYAWRSSHSPAYADRKDVSA